MQNRVPNLARRTARAGEQAVVEHNAGPHADIAANKDERVVFGAAAKLVFTQSSRVGIVLRQHAAAGNAGICKGGIDHGQKIDISPA